MEEMEIGNGGGGAYLVWEELTAVLPHHGSGRAPKKLLHGLTGFAVPGRLMAVMGPSGSGKSTLLDSLSGIFIFLFFGFYIYNLKVSSRFIFKDTGFKTFLNPKIFIIIF